MIDTIRCAFDTVPSYSNIGNNSFGTMKSSSSSLPSMIETSASTTTSTASAHDQSWRVQGALVAAQVFFGLGAVVGALGLPATHPLVFALAREFWAGLALLSLSVYALSGRQRQKQHEGGTCRTTRLPLDAGKKDVATMTATSTMTSTLSLSSPWHEALWYSLLAWRVHWKSFATLGLVVFGNQAGFIVGIKLAGPVTASVWQPCQPIFTAAICMSLGWEPLQSKRIAGILTAFCGCMAMVLLKQSGSSSGSGAAETILSEEADNAAAADLTTSTASHSALRYLVGNALLCTNCLCTSLFVILSKRMLTLYPSLLVTAWSYNFATIYMALATALASTVPAVQTLLCPDCDTTSSLWTIPAAAWPALLYYVIFASVGSYGLLTWANQYATGTLVMSYSVLQPTVAVVVTTALLVLRVVASCSTPTTTTTPTIAAPCLEYPTAGTFCGMVGVLLGLLFIIATEVTAKKNAPNTSSGSNKKRHQDEEYEEKKDDDQEMIALVANHQTTETQGA